MKTPWFDNIEDLETLDRVARSWLGTPFRQNGRVKGVGVSCHLLVGSIYIECGVLPESARIPDGPAYWARAQARPLIEEFLLEDPTFSARFDAVPGLACQPGDLLGFKVNKVIHHLGVLVAGHYFVHCYMHLGTVLARIDDDTYARRLSAVWRPMRG